MESSFQESIVFMIGMIPDQRSVHMARVTSQWKMQIHELWVEDAIASHIFTSISAAVLDWGRES